MSLRNCGEVIDPDEQLWVVPIVENDLSEAWQNRIKRAYNDKVKKLASWKRDYSNARTVLILETVDSSIWTVADAILDIVTVAETDLMKFIL
jgi:hypothetical protein